MAALTVYRLKSNVVEDPEDWDSFVDFEQWGGRMSEPLDSQGDGFSARLFPVEGEPHEPRWLPLLRAGFGDQFEVANQAAPGALLIVRVEHGGSPAFFAFTFGVGRFLLKDEAFVRNFGLRVALNAIFEGDLGEPDFDASRLRSVTSRRPSANTLRQQGQASRDGAIDAFDLDLERDLLAGVAGRPQSDEHWGSQLSGSNALHLNRAIEFKDLGALCSRLCAAHESHDYKQRFSWIDDVSRVEDPQIIDQLEATVVALLQAEQVDDLDLSVPEFVEWSRIDRFKLPYAQNPPVLHPEARLVDYLGAVKLRNGDLNGLTRKLLSNHRVDAIDADGHRSYSWPVWRCLSGTIDLNGTSYVLDDGDFFVVSASYVQALNDYISLNIPMADVALPVGLAKEDEDEFNEFAAKSAHLLLLDKKLVHADKFKTAVELCDLLGVDKRLIHVKRKLGSSTLSHLFAQGYVSAELLLTDQQFRTRAADVVAAAKGNRPDDCAPLEGDVDFISEHGFKASEFEICFAIIADWKGMSLAERLPFFSKVNLRRVVAELRKMQFKVSHSCVPALVAAERPNV